MLGNKDQFNVTFTITEATEAYIAVSVALDDAAYMSLPDTNREALVSAMLKIYAAQLPHPRAAAS